MRDFELAIANSLTNVWPEIDQKGCEFHMSKNIFKQVITSGLKVEYSQRGNDHLVNLVHSAIGLAYVPLEMINVSPYFFFYMICHTILIDIYRAQSFLHQDIKRVSSFNGTFP